MRTLIILSLAVLTSTCGYLYAKWVLRLPGHGLLAAGRALLECVWLACVFFVLNLLVGLATVLAARAFARFISLHDVNDVSLALISLLQGTLFRLWRAGAASVERNYSSHGVPSGGCPRREGAGEAEDVGRRN